jgi:hybrid polyketide synthase/nonribosomal peptide synthetase ACE1
LRALPISHDFATEDVVSDLDPSETEVKDMWLEVLPIEMSKNAVFTRSSDFFRFVGSSLVMVELHDLITKKYGVTLSLLELFQASTLGEMARKIKESIGHVAI